ncbi:MAG: DUF1643 domain-containing protein [Chloroflexi bacterium]|nr:DUF1643 domain-containing protein [Chloroflexota bacterium]
MDVVRSNTASFSKCGRYRYLLTREFGSGSTCVFVMLNPSTADAAHDDPTIRRCIGFAKREGYGRLEVVNLYGFRTSEPSVLFVTSNPVGDDNDSTLLEAVSRAGLVIVAWGNHGATDPERVRAVTELISRTGKAVKCFGFTSMNQPKHPLYLHSETELATFCVQ